MNKLFYIFCFFLFFQSCFLQKNAKKTEEYKIEASENVERYAKFIDKKELKDHLYVIASDKYKGRETGKEGQKLTEKYLVNEFKNDGVQPGNKGSYLQNFELIESLPPNANFSFKGEEFFFCKHFYFFPSYANFSSFTIDINEIYDIQYGIKDEKRDDYAGLNIKDKVLVSRLDNPSGYLSGKWGWRDKMKLAKDAGAKCILFVTDNMDFELERLKHFLEQPTMRLKDTKVKTRNGENIPFFFISNDMYTTLFSEGEGKESELDKKLSFNIKRVDKELQSSNVLGFIEGSDDKLKEEVIVITAHYDHIGVKGEEVFNGADDDGSGTVGLLEIAEAFQQAKNDGNGPKRSILIMPVSGEEKGLLGSSYYTSNPIFPLENTVANLNIDMIGRIDENHEGNANYVYLIGADRISEELHNLSEKVNEKYSGLDLDYTYNADNDPNRYYYRSDHYNFAKNGIPVIFYFNGTHEDYHESSDTVEKINFEKIEKITRLVFHTAWEIANRKERLTIDR